MNNEEALLRLEERKQNINKQEKKIKACVKTFKLLNIFSYISFALSLTGCAFAIARNVNESKAEDIVKGTNYTAYNQEYKIDTADQLLEDLKEGKISYGDFTKAVDKVEDYSVDKFMAEQVDANLASEYSKYRDIEDATGITGIVVCSTGVAMAVGALVANPITKKRKKNAEDEIKDINREFFLGHSN